MLKSRSAFTFIELIVSISLLFLVSLAGLTIVQNQSAGALSADAKIIEARLSEAQSRAISGVSNNSWGIRFYNATDTTPYYALFEGTSFTTTTRTYFLSGLVGFQDPTSGSTTDMIFSKLSGTLSTSTSIIIRLKSDSSLIKTISVTGKGSITSQ